MTDYKETLNLPQTGFPMKANLAQREPERVPVWQDIYRKQREQAKGKPQFVLHNGPPYANGRIHMGHALNQVIKDIVNKSKQLSGLDAPNIPGWDCHGLPIEMMVEKKKGKAGIKIEPAAFREACREFAESQVTQQRDDFKRLGILADWEHPYLTMRYDYEAHILRCFAQITQNGHLFKGVKPVHWCVECGSALAEAEVEYSDHESPAIHVRFPVVDEAKFLAACKAVSGDALGQGRVSVPIWTTTPWTLPANQAVALHPEFKYALVQAGNERLLLASDLVDSVMSKYACEDYTVVAHCLGKDLEGLLLQHPLFDKQVPIVLGEHVTVEAGTGAVHTAPAHGPDDFALGQQYGLEVETLVNARGCFSPDTPLFADQFVFKANGSIIETLKERELLLSATKIRHSYPHCWRHGTPIIFRATPQWFISMTQAGLRDNALAAVENVRWEPEWGETRMAKMLTTRPDWCISRQRYWGTPIPLFVHKVTGELHPDTLMLIEKVAEKVEAAGIEAWFSSTIEEWLGEEADDYEKSTDTLDVWFDAGVSSAYVLENRDDMSFPADLYLEGSDQHRGWFQSSLLTAIARHGHAPYKKVVTHGYVVDAKGHKMSKSRGNIIEPQKIINQYGADVLRLWVATTDYRGEVSVSDEILKRASDIYRRLRNTARFLLSNLNGFDPQKDQLPFDELLALDRWAIDCARRLQVEVQQAYEEYQFHHVCQKVHHFCAIEMGSFYLDIIKDRQYTTQENSRARRSAQTAMYHIIEAMVRWLAPIISFTAEEIYEHMPGERAGSVFLDTWYENLPVLPESEPMNAVFWKEMMRLRDAVNKVLEQQQLNASLKVDLNIYASEKWLTMLAPLKDELRFVLITSTAVAHPEEARPKDALVTDLPDVWITVEASTAPKCVRCWHHREDVGQEAAHPELCVRCVDNITGPGEQREFA